MCGDRALPCPALHCPVPFEDLGSSFLWWQLLVEDVVRVLCTVMLLHPFPRAHSLPFVGQLGKRDGCQKTHVLYLENRDYPCAFYIHK